VSRHPQHRKAHPLSIAAAAEPGAQTDPNPQHLEAYDVFLRGRHEWQSLERHRMQDGMQHLSRAIELDPALIAAKIDLVHLCVTQAFYGYMPPSVTANLLYRTAESVSDLPHRAASILPSLGWVNFHVDHNLPAALRAFSLSAHLPHDTFTTRERCQFALGRHRFDEAISLLQNALKEDPHSPWLQARLAWTFHLAGRAEESMDTLRRALALYPDHDGVAFYGSVVLACNGQAAEGLRLADEVSARQPHIDLLKAVRAYALACVGRTQEARTILEGLLWLGRERFVARAFIPAVYVALGDLDAAIHELNTANNDRCPWLFQILADPRLRPLHGHPEFEKICAILPRMEAAALAESGDGRGTYS
jgi:tetratricopeptide (TPR) repeat protein